MEYVAFLVPSVMAAVAAIALRRQLAANFSEVWHTWRGIVSFERRQPTSAGMSDDVDARSRVSLAPDSDVRNFDVEPEIVAFRALPARSDSALREPAQESGGASTDRGRQSREAIRSSELTTLIRGYAEAPEADRRAVKRLLGMPLDESAGQS